jgi:coatomer protein complex subunit gamma
LQPQGEVGLSEDFIIPQPSVSSSSSPGIVYVSFTRESPEEYPIASFSSILKFVSKEVDPSTGEPDTEGYEDEYELEDLQLSAGSDYIIPSYANFSAEWEKLGSAATATETFALSTMDSLKCASFVDDYCLIGAEFH